MVFINKHHYLNVQDNNLKSKAIESSLRNYIYYLGKSKTIYTNLF